MVKDWNNPWVWRSWTIWLHGMKWKKHNISLRVIFTGKNGDLMKVFGANTFSAARAFCRVWKHFSLGCPTPLLLQGKACGRPGFLQTPCLPLNNLVIGSSPVSLKIMQSLLLFPTLYHCNVRNAVGWTVHGEVSWQTVYSISVRGHYSLLMSASTCLEWVCQGSDDKSLWSCLSSELNLPSEEYEKPVLINTAI